MTRGAVAEEILQKTAYQSREEWVVYIVFAAAMGSKANVAEKGPLQVKLK